jgi:hypothetical protein
MLGASSLITLLVVWAAITAVFIALLIWKSFAGMREEDQLFIDPVEAKQEQEQREIISKVERIAAWAKGFGFTSAALLLVIAGMWIYQGFTAFNKPPMP